MKEKADKKTRKLNGIVVSDKMDKTRVVAVNRFVKHPKYDKIHKRTKRFKAHDENNQYKEGDFVVIVETRPMSKDKKWVISGLVKENKTEK